MRDSRNISFVRSVMVMLSLVLLASCTLVDLENSDASEKSKIAFEIEWPDGISEDDKPHDIMVVMSRTQKATVHYVRYLDATGAFVEPEIITAEETDETGAGATDPDDETDGEATEPEEDGIDVILNGYYAISALGTKETSELIVSNVEEFGNSIDSKMGDIFVEIPEDNTLASKFIDVNPLYPYLKNIHPFFYVRPGLRTHTLITPGTSGTNVISLRFQPLTRKITFTLKLDIEAGVKVESLVGIISGIPSKVQLMSGHVRNVNTGKMAFEMTTRGNGIYTGSIHAFGLFAQNDSNPIVGPGVFTAFISASVGEDSALRHMSINLRDVILGARIMLQDESDRSQFYFSDMENVDGHVANVRDYQIEIPAMPIRKEWILYGSGEGFEDWVPNEDHKDDPGLNPEI